MVNSTLFCEECLGHFSVTTKSSADEKMSLCQHLSSDDKNEALREAAKDGHLDCVKALLEVGADVNEATNDGDSSVAKNGRKEESRSRVKSMKYHKPPLHYAAENGHEQIVKHLIEKGANVNIATDSMYEKTALRCAVRNGHEHVVKCLVESGADLATDKREESVVHCAAANGHENVLKYLIDVGADVDQLDFRGWTALTLAACSGEDQCVDVLLKGGANVNNDEQCDHPLLYAAGLDSMYNVHAGGYGSEKCVELLLNAGADVNVTNEEGVTALMAAAFSGYSSALDALIEAGADVNATDDRDYTALTTIGVTAFDYKTKEHFASAQKCLRAGAHVNKKNEDGETTLKLFKDSPLPKIFCQLLEAAGEGINDKETESDTTGTLKHLCREKIRKHLLGISPVNLFCRIPLLGLPSLLNRYILYDMSLDQEYEDENNTDSNDNERNHQA